MTTLMCEKIKNMKKDIKGKASTDAALSFLHRACVTMESAGNGLLDFVFLFKETIPEIAALCLKHGITKVTVSYSGACLLDMLHEFECTGFKVCGLTHINSAASPSDMIPAVLLVHKGKSSKIPNAINSRSDFAFPEDMKAILAYLHAHGTLCISAHDVEKRYGKFSEENYCVKWLKYVVVDDSENRFSNECILEKFAKWLEKDTNAKGYILNQS